MRERHAQNPGAELYSHWMKMIHKRAVEALNYTREAMKKYYDRKALQQPDYKEGDLVMLNGKNIRTKRPSKKFTSQALWTVQDRRGKGPTRFQTRNIAYMEDPPDLPCFAVRTLLNLSPTRKRPASARARRDLWRSRMGSGTDCKE